MDGRHSGRRAVVSVGSRQELDAFTSRRGFLRLMGLGGALVMLPSFAAACGDNNDGVGLGVPNSGESVTIDFARGDTAVLQFAYALEQLEADFYTQVVASFGASNFTAADQAILADIKNHEIIHRDFLKAALAGNASFTLTPTYGSLDFKSRTAVLTAARTFEDLGVAAYNGAAQYLTDVNNLGLAGKIVSVEARHASAIRDLLAPKSAEFAPNAFDDAFYPGKVAASAQGYIVEKLAFSNAPSSATFVQGPNKNGT